MKENDRSAAMDGMNLQSWFENFPSTSVLNLQFEKSYEISKVFLF